MLGVRYALEETIGGAQNGNGDFRTIDQWSEAFAMALAGLPTLRLVFGSWLVTGLAGGIDAALIAAILPGPIIFVAGLAAMRAAFRLPRTRLPDAFWSDLGRFTLSASTSALLLLGFWNLDMVLVRALFPIPFQTMHWVVRQDGDVKSLADLAGHPFVPGTRGSFGERQTASVLKLLGLDESDDCRCAPVADRVEVDGEIAIPAAAHCMQIIFPGAERYPDAPKSGHAWDDRCYLQGV